MTFYHSKFGFKENFDILHAATVHEGKKLFKCDNCDANFGQKCSLKCQPLEFKNSKETLLGCDRK